MKNKDENWNFSFEKNEQIKASHTGKGIGRKLFHML
jgi:hypothetical protein